MVRVRVINLVSAIAVGLAFAGCGGSPPSNENATILGTVTNAPPQPIDVSVEGTNLSTRTNAFGQFTLQGVPSGTVRIRFVASGIDVRIEVSGLTPGATLRITVRLTNSGAVVMQAPNEIELTGQIDSIAGPNLRISGITVITNADTELKRSGQRINFMDLRVGQFVQIEGSINAEGKVVARKIRLLLAPEQSRVRIHGLIELIAPPNLKVSGVNIATDANTRFNVRSFSKLKVGNVVQVDGTLRPDATVLARSIEREKIEHGEDEAEDEHDD